MSIIIITRGTFFAPKGFPQTFLTQESVQGGKIMKTHLRVLAIVVSILAIGCGTASAYEKEDMMSVVINMDGVPRMVSTDKETVGELLDEMEGTLDGQYVLEDVEEADALSDMMTVTLTSVTEKIVSTTQSIPYETVERTTKDLAPGETRVVQEGKNGTKTIVNKQIYEGTELVSTEFVEEKIVAEPVDKIVEVGAQNVINGYTYSKAISVRATAYTPYDAGCTGITATGMKAGRGVVAVDPSVIPLGSKVYVPGYGVAIAADTGGAIKGNRLDICVDSVSEAYSWGVRNVTVYVLE